MFALTPRKIAAAAIIFFCLALVTGFVLIRLVRTFYPFRASKTPASLPANKQTNAVATMLARGARPALVTIRALSFDDKEGAQENFDHLGHWDQRAWVRYNGVDFGTGLSSVVAVVSCSPQFEGRIISFHLNKVDGPVIADLGVPATQGFEALVAPVHDATGVHDVVVTCSDGGFNLQSIKFIRPQSATNIIAATSYSAFRGIQEPRAGVVGHTDGGDWIKYDDIDFGRGVSAVAVDLAMGQRDALIEFHLDAPDGPLIATLVPTSTGSWNTFQIQEAPVQGTTGVHSLYLTFQGGKGLPDIRTLQFKAAAP